MSFFDSAAQLSLSPKYEFWNETICKRLIPATGRFEHGEIFEGSLSWHMFGNLKVCKMSATPHSFGRTDHLARVSPEDDIVAMFVQDGHIRQLQDGREVTAEAGDIILFDAAKAFVHEIDSRSLLIIRFPRARFLSRCPRANQLMGVKIAELSSMATILHGMAEETFRLSDSRGPRGVQARFAAAILDTLTAAMDMQIENDSAVQRTRYEAVYQKAADYIDANLDDCELDVNDVALATCTSPRTLARIFAARGTTVMHSVWRRRLEESHSLLREGRVEQVSQAAYQCGFNDLSHFSRLFKGAYGATPRQTLLESRGMN